MYSFKQYISEMVLPSKEETLGISRFKMPQIDAKHHDHFVAYTKKNGINVKNKTLNPSTLIATQSQFNKAKISAITDSMVSGKYKPNPIMVSNDGYVLDGHHRWLAHKELKQKIPVLEIGLPVDKMYTFLHEYPKSYTKKLAESFDCILTESGEVCPVITMSHMKEFEKLVDRIFDKYGIDFSFTKHFRERMSDGRNNPCISLKELAQLIKKIYDKKGKGRGIFTKHADTEVVLKDMQTDLNVPIAIEYDRNKDEFDVVAKTVMRKKNFRTPNPEIKL